MPSKVKKPVKRTKTFSGCWTCRSRGVKCDLAKPACARCTRSKRVCEGYGIRLVWVGQEPEPNKAAERRLVNGPHQRNPVFSEDHLETAIEDLDAFGSQYDLQIQPFTVFRAFEVGFGDDLDDYFVNDDFDAASDVNDGDFAILALSPVTTSYSDSTSTSDGISSLNPYSPLSVAAASDVDETVDEEVGRKDEDSHGSGSMKARLLPLLQMFLSEATMDERKLLHHWVTSMSGMLVAIPSTDNPYKNLYIPFALAAANAPGGFSGHSALLHGMYAVSATNLAELRRDEKYSVAAIKHQHLSLQRLRSSLGEIQLRADGEQLNQERQVILAVILLLSTIDIISGTSSTWRIHLREGKRYLKSIFSQPTMTKNTSILYQFFLCLDMIGSESRSDDYFTPSENEDQHNQLCLTDALKNDERINGDYCLDRMFGITKPVAEIILATNHLIHRNREPSEEELSALESQIILANPCTDAVSDDDPQTARMLRHHRCAFYFAAVIHFRKSVCKVPSSQLQHLVEDSLYHLQMIDTIEANLNVSGLFWPVFVTACEADEETFREVAMHLFSKGERCGIGNIKKGLQVVQEVWARRDGGCSEAYSSRTEVMKHLGLDLLLA